MHLARSPRPLLMSAAVAAAVLGLGACSGSNTGGITASASSFVNSVSLPPASPSVEASASLAPSASGAVLASLTGVNTTITFASTVAEVLKRANIDVTATGGATGSLSGSPSFTFPITGGTVQLGAASPSGTIDHQGGLEFSAGGRSVTAQDFVIQLSDGTVTANVKGARVPLFELDLSKATVNLNGQTATLSGIPVTLPQSGASAISDAIGATLPSVTLGTATSTLKG